jgi:hypothetical protein
VGEKIGKISKNKRFYFNEEKPKYLPFTQSAQSKSNFIRQISHMIRLQRVLSHFDENPCSGGKSEFVCRSVVILGASSLLHTSL